MVGHARYASLTRYVELGQSVGIDPARLMRAVGLDPAGLAHPDRWIPAVAVADLLTASARESGEEAFGLRLAELRAFSNLGPLSLVLREEPDVRSALALMIRYEHTYNESVHLEVVEQDGVASVRFRLDFSQRTDTRQSTDLVLGILCGVLREFLGQDWYPLSVSTPHPAPADLTVHQRILGSQIQFDQPHAGLVLYEADLDTPVQDSDPGLRGYARQVLQSLGAPRGESDTEYVRRVVESLLPAGRCSARQVARHLNADRRTLHRHLEAEGTTYSAIVDSTRRDLAERFLLNDRQSITEIAHLLGFAAPSGFSRWFRSRYHCSPSEWLASSRQLTERHLPTDTTDNDGRE